MSVEHCDAVRGRDVEIVLAGGRRREDPQVGCDLEPFLFECPCQRHVSAWEGIDEFFFGLADCDSCFWDDGGDDIGMALLEMPW